MTHLELCVKNVAEAWRNPGPYPVIHEQEKATLYNRWPTLHLAVKELVKAVETSKAREDEEKRNRGCGFGCSDECLEHNQ